MKQFFLLTTIILISTASGLRAQNKLSIDKVYATYLRNSGTIMEKNQIKGYYFLYQVTKLISIPMNILYRYWMKTSIR